MSRASSIEPNLPGKAGQYLSVLNCASEYGLWFEVWGWEVRSTDPQKGEQLGDRIGDQLAGQLSRLHPGNATTYLEKMSKTTYSR